MEAFNNLGEKELSDFLQQETVCVYNFSEERFQIIVIFIACLKIIFYLL